MTTLRKMIFTCALVSCVGIPLTPAIAAPSKARFGLGPDNNQTLLTETIRGAKNLLQVNAYDFTHEIVANEFIRAIERGVTLELLLETQPFKNPHRAMSTAGKKAVVRIFDAMKESGNTEHRIYLMGSNLYWDPVTRAPLKVKRRFNFNHAKYAIADQRSVLISSENLTETGHPNPGTRGNRGWDVVLTDAGTVKNFSATFAEDIATDTRDVLAVTIAGRLPSFITKYPETTENIQSDDPVQHLERKPLAPIQSGTVQSVDFLTSPKALTTLEPYLDSATRSLDVEFMSLPMEWYRGRTPHPSPLIEKMVALSQAGVLVRVLLNNDRVFAEPGSEEDTKNEQAVDYLNALARCHGISLAAKIVDIDAVEITYVHNKGMIVDGTRVLISSINGTRNSVENNRETAVAVNSPQAGQYFGGAFSNDWKKSPGRTWTQDFRSCVGLLKSNKTQLAWLTPWSPAF